jgi:hypothetical protein
MPKRKREERDTKKFMEKKNSTKRNNHRTTSKNEYEAIQKDNILKMSMPSFTKCCGVMKMKMMEKEEYHKEKED